MRKYMLLLLNLQVAGVLVFSAIPFTAVKAIATSPLGETLQKRLLLQKSAAVEDSIQRNKLAQLARNRRFFCFRCSIRVEFVVTFCY